MRSFGEGPGPMLRKIRISEVKVESTIALRMYLFLLY